MRSERLLVEQLDYNLLFRWFMGHNMDDAVWDPTVFTKNRERLLDGDIAQGFLEQAVSQAREKILFNNRPLNIGISFNPTGSIHHLL